MSQLMSTINPIFDDFHQKLEDLLNDELKSSITLIDRRNNIMNFMRFVMPHIANNIYLPLGLYKKIYDEKETLGQFREWKLQKQPSDQQENPESQQTTTTNSYKLSPPEFLIHLRDTCFHLDQFLEVPSDTTFNTLIKDAYDQVFQQYALKLKELKLEEKDLEDAAMNMEWVFKERFGVLYNKSLTSFQIGNKIEDYLSFFMSSLGRNPFYRIEGLFDDKLMDLEVFKKLFYEYRAAEASGEMASLPITFGYFFKLNTVGKLI